MAAFSTAFNDSFEVWYLHYKSQIGRHLTFPYFIFSIKNRVLNAGKHQRKSYSEPHGTDFIEGGSVGLSVSLVSISLPVQLGNTGGSSGLTHCLPVAALAALLCFVHINIKHVFQLDLFHPRRPSRSLWLLPCLTPLPTAFQSAVEHPPWSSQALHLAHPWSPACGEMDALQHPVENSSSADRFSVFSSNIWCSEFPSKSLL